MRFAVALACVATLAGIVAVTASALAFDDAKPCVDTQPIFICPQGTVQANYSIQLEGRGGCGPSLPYQYRVLNGGLPPGLSLSKSGQVSGAPTHAGTWVVWLELSDQDPPSQTWCNPPQKAERQFSFTIHPRVHLVTEGAAPGTVGAAYTLQLQAVMRSGPDATSPPSSPLAWSLTQGELPPGLNLGAADGLISGSPTTEGSYTFSVRAALADGRSDTKSFTVAVRKPVTVTADPTVVPKSEVGEPFELKLVAAGGTETFTWTIKSGSLPSGVALGTDGSITGTPQTGGRFAITVTASDTETPTPRATDYSAVINVADRLEVTRPTPKPAKVGKRFGLRLRTTGGILPKVWRITKGPLPRGVRFDKRLGVLAGIPTKAGRYRITVEATDSLKVKARTTFTIVVKAPPPAKKKKNR